jgi:Protein of unknown function (DUF2909)
MGYFIALFLLLIIASLGAAGFFMLRRKPQSLDQDGEKPTGPNRHMAKALAVRVGLSITLFLCVLVSWRMGWIQPTGLPLR